MNKRRFLLILTVLVIFVVSLNAEDKRIIPMDMYLIIDGSSALKNSKEGAVSWINEQVVDRILIEGDRITVWNAGEKAQIIYSETISASSGKGPLKDTLQTLDTEGKTADFPGALSEVLPRVSQTPKDRLSYTMLITASAEGLEPVLRNGSQNLLRWFRSERYERWQVLIIGLDIGQRARTAAMAVIGSIN